MEQRQYINGEYKNLYGVCVGGGKEEGNEEGNEDSKCAL